MLSHIYPDGSERVIQYASQTLSKTQQSYSQIDKEAYAIIFGIKKFYQYLQGAKFTLITDHHPLTQIFSPTKSLPIFTASRMQHYALFLQGFNYDIKYRKSELHSNADCLSRLPIPRTNESECDVIDEYQESTFETLPVTAEQVAKATSQDKELSQLLNCLKCGRDSFKNNKFFTVPLNEFILFNGVIFRGHRVVIPYKLQKTILAELHVSHFGIIRMKHLARSYVWWKQIDKDIEKIAQNCSSCNTFRNDPSKISLGPAEEPFERVHADFAGPFLNNYFFILIDAYTKWPEIHIVKNITKEFTNFLNKNGVTHKLTAPYHPATNGQAERYVQILKNLLKRMQTTHANVQVNLQRLLTQYRNTLHAITGKSPAEMLYSCKLRTRLDLLKPVVNKYSMQCALISFTEEERVSARNYIGKEKWLFGRISERIGTLHYKVCLDDGRTWKRHVNQLRLIGENTPSKSEDHITFFNYASPDTIVHGNVNDTNINGNPSNTYVYDSTRDNVHDSTSDITIKNSTNMCSPCANDNITLRNTSDSIITSPITFSYSSSSQGYNVSQ